MSNKWREARFPLLKPQCPFRIRAVSLVLRYQSLEKIIIEQTRTNLRKLRFWNTDWQFACPTKDIAQVGFVDSEGLRMVARAIQLPLFDGGCNR